jgi:para-nitrobenzyl esterase
MAMPPAERLFRRAILQSPALLPPFPKEEAIEISHRYRAALGAEGVDLQGLRSATVDRLLAAQLDVATSVGRLADLRPPFQFVTDGTVLKRDFNDELRTGAGAGVDVVIGSNRGELRLPVPEDTTYEQVIGRIRPAAGGAAEALIAEYAAAVGDGSSAHLLGPLLTDEYIFRMLRLAGDQVRSGYCAYVYTFDWAPAGSRFGCCHTLELPFVFDNFAAWAASPMLEGADPAEMTAVGRPVHTAWASFAARGEPQPAGGPRWEPYDPFTRKAMRFGSSPPVMENAPGGPTLSLWDRLY